MRSVLLLFALASYVLALQPVPGETVLPQSNEELSRIWKARKIVDLQTQIENQKSIITVAPLYSSSLIEQCEQGNPVFLEASVSDLPASGRRNGDPCAHPSDCASGYCLCQPYGGKECHGSPQLDELVFSWHSWESPSFQVASGASKDTLLAQEPKVAPTTGYCKKNVDSWKSFTNRGICGGSRSSNIGQLITLAWHQQCDQYGSFRIGVDWGYGGGIIINDELFTVVPSNVNFNWWSGNWGASSGVVVIPERLWVKGWHTIQFIGFEPCCDGAEEIQFKNRVGDWKTVDESFCFGPCDA